MCWPHLPLFGVKAAGPGVDLLALPHPGANQRLVFSSCNPFRPIRGQQSPGGGRGSGAAAGARH